MKITRSAAVVVALVFVTVAILAFLYGAPAGRKARRESLRAFRLARNASGMSPVPSLTVRTWDGATQGLRLVEVYESGRLAVSGRGERLERQLTRRAAERIIEMGKPALGDFGSHGCRKRPTGRNAALDVLIDGAWARTVCLDASADWPSGREAKRLLAEIESQVPGVFGR